MLRLIRRGAIDPPCAICAAGDRYQRAARAPKRLRRLARVVPTAELGGEIGRQDQMIDQRQQLGELRRRDILEIGDHCHAGCARDPRSAQHNFGVEMIDV